MLSLADSAFQIVDLTFHGRWPLSQDPQQHSFCSRSCVCRGRRSSSFARPGSHPSLANHTEATVEQVAIRLVLSLADSAFQIVDLTFHGRWPVSQVRCQQSFCSHSCVCRGSHPSPANCTDATVKVVEARSQNCSSRLCCFIGRQAAQKFHVWDRQSSFVLCNGRYGFFDSTPPTTQC